MCKLKRLPRWLERMKQKEEQNEREIAELRNQLSRAASLMTPQVI